MGLDSSYNKPTSGNLNSEEFTASSGRGSLSIARSPRKAFLWAFDFLILPLLLIALASSQFYRDGLFLSWDEGLPLYWGNAILHGKVPLKDFNITFGPFYVYLLAACMKMFGASLATLRIYVYCGSMVSLTLVYFAARMLIKRRLLLLLLCLYVGSFAIAPFWMSRWGGIRSGIALIPLIFLIQHIRTNTPHSLMLCGVTAATSFIMSQEMGVLAVGLFLIYIAYTRLTIIRNSGLFLLGFMAVALPAYVFLLVSGASLQGLYINLVRMPIAMTSYYRNPPRIDFPMATFSSSQWLNYLQSPSFDIVLAPVIYIAATAYLLTAAMMRRKGESRADDLVFLLVLFLGFFLFVTGIRGFSGPSFAGPQFTFSLAVTAVVGLAMLERILFWFEAEGPKRGVLFQFAKYGIVFLVVAGIVVTKVTPSYRQQLKYSVSMISHARPKIDMSPQIGNCLIPQGQFDLIAKVREFITSHTAVGEYIYVYPHDPHLYFFSDRYCPTFFPLAIDSGIDETFQKGEIADIEKKGVRYAICVSNSYAVMDNRPIPNEERIPLLYSYFRKNFAVVKDFEGTLILERQSAGEDVAAPALEP